MNRSAGATFGGPAEEAQRRGDRDLETACQEGIVTLADDRFFVGLVLLYLSVQQNYPVPMVCFDGGLTQGQKKWARANMPACTIRPIPDTPEVRQIRRSLHGMSENLTEEWLLWVCPLLIASSPFRRTLWLDSDLVVLRGLGQLFQFIERGPVFTPENHDPPNTPNHPQLYDLLPIGRRFDRGVPLINGGVSGWDLERDAEVLGWYRYPVLQAARDPQVKTAIRWHDQGSLIWAIQKAGCEHRVLESYDWNLCAEWIDDPNKPYAPNADLLDTLRNDYPSTNIVHWNGFLLQDKLGARLGPEPEVLDALRGILPGRGHRAATPARSRIKLMSHVGCKANALLIERFLEHYVRLGVDDFLIILQGEEGDPRLDEARKRLAAQGVRPVLEVPDFSAPLKLRRFLEILDANSDPDDWVLTADVDELQVYPQALPRFLKECDELGYTFVRGRFIDRIGVDGRLPTIQPLESLWGQFPLGGSVTSQVTGGWANKVCAMKGWLRLADGGSHGLDYGVDGRRNYSTTHRDPHGHPDLAEIHHFKWDAGLLGRTNEKLLGIGGDRDGEDGPEFLHEYRALGKHLELHGRLKVDEIQYLGEPQLHYVRPPPARLHPKATGISRQSRTRMRS